MEFRDLKRQYQAIKTEIDKGIKEVVSSSNFISGMQVKELENKLAAYVGVNHCISCGNGTDAISIALMAHGIGEAGGGNKCDAVFVPDFTFFSSGECSATVGATPIFVDVRQDTYNIDAVSLERVIKRILLTGKLRPRAVIAVDLFGLPADYGALKRICEKYELLLLEDGAQGFGGTFEGKRACSFGDVATTSFFPAKPLGCYGDGGAIFTDDDEIASLCRSIAVHGKDMGQPNDPDSKYNNVRLGMNSRLDTLQAAILLPKFKAFMNYELINVNRVASVYNSQLCGITGLVLPVIADGFYSSWAQYTVQLPEGVERSVVQAKMREAGIPTMIYYVKPMHMQEAFAGTESALADCPVTEKLCKSVLCLPIHPYLTESEVDFICKTFKNILHQI